MKMILCGNFLFLILVILIKTESLALSLSQSSYYHYKIEHFNPYSHINNNDTFVLRQKLKKPLHQQPEEEQTSPQWKTIDTTNATDNNSFRRRVMVGYGKKPLNESALLATGSMNLVLYNDRTSVNHNQFGRRQALVEQTNQESIDFQQQPLPYYQCDSITQDYRFIIESPNYPAEYPGNRICTYYIGRNRSDICQIELTFSDMDIEDTPQCTADYLNLGANYEQERLCGLMLRNSRRIINFPSNTTYIRITFRSDGKNDRTHRGFSAEIQQIPNSCFNQTLPLPGPLPPKPYPRVSPSQIPYPNPYYFTRQKYPGFEQQHPIAFGQPSGHKYQSTGKNTGYGQRLYPPIHPPYFQRPNIDPARPTINYDPSKQPRDNGGQKIPYLPDRPSNRSIPIYLASYCDVYIGDFHGEIRSPNYPFGYPTNHSCVYTIKKASSDVCQVELVFHHFDVQTTHSKKDLTDNCYGDYLQMPDNNRLCGYYTQSMSGDYKLKKYYVFPESSEYIFMHFNSDSQPTPDGSGFWVEVRQLPNTCKADFNYRNVCDRVILGQYSSVERIYSPNYPQFYQPRSQCVYLIQPMDSKTCEFELDLVQFNLEPSSKQDGNTEECRKDYLQLPNRQKICGQHKFRRIFQFPNYHDRTAMFYFYSDDQIEDRGFEIIVRQLPNSCTNYSQQDYNGSGVWNTNVYIPTQNTIDSNTNQPPLQPTPVFTYDNGSGLQPYQPPFKPPDYYPRKYPENFDTKVIIPSFPSYWNSELPSILNDPKNVDSSGTIPLYFANGTLATRVPPMKPVDMIPFLKKGKTVIQKGSSGRLFPAINNLNDFGAITSNRFPGPEDILQSSARLKKDDLEVEKLTSEINIQPAYKCDQIVTKPIEYIRSPNFPNNYPEITRCIYTIVKSDNSVCQIRLHLLSLDLEYTEGCKNDYLKIDTTGEKLCGRTKIPEVKTLNYFGHSRDMRLIFNSDRQATGSGFEIRIEQLNNSCDETLQHNDTVFSRRSFYDPLLPVTKMPADTTPFERLQVESSPMSAEALTNSNNSDIDKIVTSMPRTDRICRTTSILESYFESENFPLEYPSNIDCLFKVFRANKNVCRLEIDFDEFNVGNENTFEDKSIGHKNEFRPVGDCPNDFLMIDGVRYCGKRSGQKVALNFPKEQNELDFRFISREFVDLTERFNGFRIKIRQIDENCRTSFDRLREKVADKVEDGFIPAIIESCPKLGSFNQTNLMSDRYNNQLEEIRKLDSSLTISEKKIRIRSPKFGLISPSVHQYEPFLDCHYVIQKTNKNVCALEIKFELFSLEESKSCVKDFLEINQSLRLCGKLPTNTNRVFDFFDERMLIHFHTDSDQNDQGFSMILRQIQC